MRVQITKPQRTKLAKALRAIAIEVFGNDVVHHRYGQPEKRGAWPMPVHHADQCAVGGVWAEVDVIVPIATGELSVILEADAHGASAFCQLSPRSAIGVPLTEDEKRLARSVAGNDYSGKVNLHVWPDDKCDDNFTCIALAKVKSHLLRLKSGNGCVEAPRPIRLSEIEDPKAFEAAFYGKHGMTPADASKRTGVAVAQKPAKVVPNKYGCRNPVKKGDVVALAVAHSSTYAFGSGRGTERRITYTLARVGSATRHGEAKTLHRAGSRAVLRSAGNYASFKLADVLPISDQDKQDRAQRLFATFKGEWPMGATGPDDEFETVDALRAAILATPVGTPCSNMHEFDKL
jgi:hypothetical protein